MNRQKGYQLIELIVLLALIGLISGIGLPSLLRASRGLRVGLAAGEVVGALRSAKLFAIRHNLKVGVKFRVDSRHRVTFALYRDGNGNGIRTREIDSGVDPQVAPPRTLAHLGRRIRFGFPSGPAPRDPGDPSRRLHRLHDPIRFNRSDIASFNPLGGSTPGSLYLTDGSDHLMAVRVLGRTGRVRSMRYDRESETWR